MTLNLQLQESVAAITPKTKLLIINNPNNSTGVVYTEKELKVTGEILKKSIYLYFK